MSGKEPAARDCQNAQDAPTDRHTRSTTHSTTGGLVLGDRVTLSDGYQRRQEMLDGGLRTLWPSRTRLLCAMVSLRATSPAAPAQPGGNGLQILQGRGQLSLKPIKIETVYSATPLGELRTTRSHRSLAGGNTQVNLEIGAILGRGGPFRPHFPLVDIRRSQERPGRVSDRDAYFALVSAHPELFRNPPGAGIEILLDRPEIERAETSEADQLERVGAPVEWAEVGVAFRDQYLFLVRDAVRFADGSLGTYIRAVDPDGGFPGVVVLPVWQGKVLLVRHFRHATRAWHLEIPRGFGICADSTESAKIELAEEIGAAEIELIRLGQAYPDASAESSTVDCFYAKVGSYGRPDGHEPIAEILPTPVTEFERMIRDRELTDGFLLMTYGLAKARELI